MKRVNALVLSLVLTASLFTGCGKQEVAEDTTAQAASVEEQAEETAAEETEEVVAEEETAEETAQEEADADSVTITDDAGQTYTIKLPIESIVPTDSGPFITLSAFGLTDKVVGTHQSIVGNPLYPSLQELPVIATWSEVNFEMLAELSPQVVLSSMESHGVITENENLKDFDISDVKLDLRNPDKMRDDIALLGTLFNNKEKADEIIAFYDKWQKVVDDGLANIPEEDRVNVFLEFHGGDYNTGTEGSAWYRQIELAGGNNIITPDMGSNKTIEVSPEFVAEQNPDIIVKENSSLGAACSDLDQVKADYQSMFEKEGYNTTDAVKNGRIYMVGNDAFSRPGYIVGVCYLAKSFYPEQFADLNVDDVLKEYFEIFFPGIDVQGIWYYNE